MLSSGQPSIPVTLQAHYFDSNMKPERYQGAAGSNWSGAENGEAPTYGLIVAAQRGVVSLDVDLPISTPFLISILLIFRSHSTHQLSTYIDLGEQASPASSNSALPTPKPSPSPFREVLAAEMANGRYTASTQDDSDDEEQDNDAYDGQSESDQIGATGSLGDHLSDSVPLTQDMTLDEVDITDPSVRTLAKPLFIKTGSAGGVRILQLGRYTTTLSQYPNDFKCVVKFHDWRDQSRMIWYTASILSNGKYELRPIDVPNGKVFVATTATTLFKSAVSTGQRLVGFGRRDTEGMLGELIISSALSHRTEAPTLSPAHVKWDSTTRSSSVSSKTCGTSTNPANATTVDAAAIPPQSPSAASESATFPPSTPMKAAYVPRDLLLRGRLPCVHRRTFTRFILRICMDSKGIPMAGSRSRPMATTEATIPTIPRPTR